LEFEVTESVLIEHGSEALGALEDLGKHGAGAGLRFFLCERQIRRRIYDTMDDRIRSVLAGTCTPPLQWARRWEESDLGPAGHPNTPQGSAPIFRSFLPVECLTRTFPQLTDLLSNTPPSKRAERTFITWRSVSV